jgi:hypothetical protein
MGKDIGIVAAGRHYFADDIIKVEVENAMLRAELARLTAYVDTLVAQAREMEAETGKAKAEVKLLHEAIDKSNAALIEAIKTAEELTKTRLQIRDLREALESISRLEPGLTIGPRAAWIAEGALKEKRNDVCPLCYHSTAGGPHPVCEANWAKADPDKRNHVVGICSCKERGLTCDFEYKRGVTSCPKCGCIKQGLV